MASKVSERAVSACGGVLFVLFGLHALYVGPE
jgi:putative Ca2+/H+ antiporter (TMEM165/GDT1 family)